MSSGAISGSQPGGAGAPVAVTAGTPGQGTPGKPKRSALVGSLRLSGGGLMMLAGGCLTALGAVLFFGNRSGWLPTFPFAGTTRFEGMEELPHLLCDPRSLRDGYIEALEEYLVEVRRGCARHGIDYALVRTGDYLDAVLAKFLHHRMAQKSSAKARPVTT